jgi:cell division protein FtsL
MEPVPHNRFKLPFFAVTAVIAVVFLAKGMTTVSAVMMSLVLAVSVAAVVTILSGRHPRWLQSPLDRREAKRRARV